MSTLNEAGYAIVRDAVNVARDFQFQSLNDLRTRLATRWPGQEDAIAEAIKFWASSVRECYSHGVPRL